MMRRAIVLSIGIFAVIVILGDLNFQPKIRPIAKTKAIIEIIFDESQQYESTNSQEVAILLGSATNSVSINRTVTPWVVTDTNRLFNLNSNGLLLDAWNHPLNFALRSQPDQRISASLSNEMAENTSNALIIWSSGPDGTNEYGHGDDVFPTNVFTPDRLR